MTAEGGYFFLFVFGILGTRKLGCKAVCCIRRVIVFPQYSVDSTSSEKHKVSKLGLLKLDISKAGHDFSSIETQVR